MTLTSAEYHRVRYATRKAARLCVDCQAGLQDADKVRCVECRADDVKASKRYRTTPQGRAYTNLYARQTYAEDPAFYRAWIRDLRAERKANGLCSDCGQPAACGSTPRTRDTLLTKCAGCSTRRNERRRATSDKRGAAVTAHTVPGPPGPLIRVPDDPGWVIDTLRRSQSGTAQALGDLTMATTMKPTDLATLTTTLLRDTDACPTAPLTDVACAIADQFEDVLAALVARLQSQADARRVRGIEREDALQDSPGYRNAAAWMPLASVYSVEPRRKGWRFAKIIATNSTPNGGAQPHRRVVGFVEAGTGLMWKAAGWKAPALNFPRGCIFTLPDDWECDGSFDTLTAPISLEVK